jgi:hypothetical protein
MDKNRMVQDITTEKAGIMGNSIRMVVKRKSQNGKRKTNDQERDSFSVHQPNNLLSIF